HGEQRIDSRHRGRRSGRGRRANRHRAFFSSVGFPFAKWYSGQKSVSNRAVARERATGVEPATPSLGSYSTTGRKTTSRGDDFRIGRNLGGPRFLWAHWIRRSFTPQSAPLSAPKRGLVSWSLGRR